MNNAPIFVIGTPRSGTTLTAKILGKHSRLFMPGETHFFDDIYSRRAEFGSLEVPAAIEIILKRLETIYGRFNEVADQERIEILFKDNTIRDRFKRECRDYSDVLDLFMMIQAQSEGKTRWGNNTPRDIFHIKKILEFYPEAKILLCVRDIRDFLISYKAKWKVSATHEVDRLKKLYHPIVTSVLWKSSMQLVPEIQRRVPADNFLIVHYEKLASQPDETVKRICDTICEDFEPQMLEVEVYHSSHGATGKPGISSASVGKWRQHLSPEEIWWAQKIAGTQMTSLGYASERVKPNLFKVAKTALDAVPALCRGLWANKEKRGPLLPYLIRRLMPWFQ